ncbi:MAG: hypothetical protein H6767_02215 [Candidatus Peribacteria bacterium]|nr:MAG: hypothetical protein H6767_02215 [Candidatus Peribacteria bacterium]
MFYESLVQSINGLQVEIYLSREEREGYKHGRMDLSKMQFSPETEFYICGNPGLVAATKECLEQAGYTHIFFEKFN